MSIRPDKKVILITGAARGIGLAAARELLSRGARVVITSRNAERGKATAERIGSEWVQLDITQISSLEKAVESLMERFGRLDVLVNNSAILLDHHASLRNLKLEVLRETLETNLIGTLQTTQAFLPLLEKSDAPRIINLSSGAGQLDGEPQPWAPAYSISKTALNECRQRGLRADGQQLAVSPVRLLRAARQPPAKHPSELSFAERALIVHDMLVSGASVSKIADATGAAPRIEPV